MRQALVSAVALLPAACNPCSDELVSESTSASGRYLAALIVRDCGATTNFASHIRLRRSNEPYRDDVQPVAVFEGRIDPPVWDGDRLIVRFEDAEPFRRETAWGDVTIIYERDDATAGIPN
jgi:hypothetical protein